MELLEALQWRYAAKRMNGKTVPAEKVDRILEAARLSASSMGLQPYSILLIEDSEIRRKILPHAYNQAPITEGSHLLVFAAWDDIRESNVDEYIQNIARTRGVSMESLQGFRRSLMGIIAGRDHEGRFQWAARQTYIAFSTAIAAAAFEQVDATPMEGFQSDSLDELLNLRSMGLRSVTLLALGYRDEEKDLLASSKKVRRDKEQLVLRLTA